MKIAAILELLPAMGVACSYSFDYSALELRPDFLFTLTDLGRPVAGADVPLYRDDLLVSARTAADGSVRITGLRPGNYDLYANYLGSQGDWHFHVGARPSSKAQNEIRYAWSNQALPVPKASGTFLDLDRTNLIESFRNPRYTPEPNAVITLEDALTHETQTAPSAADGSFDFGSVPARTYYLRITAPRLNKDLLIVLDPNAEREALHVRNGNGICGTLWLER